MSTRLGERLIAAGVTTPAAVEQALQHQKVSGQRLGDSLVELGLVQEAALLRFLAAEFQTRYVTAEKLAQVKIPPHVLERLPVRVAEAQWVIPITWDRENEVLSIVAADPQNKAVLDELAVVTGIEDIVPFIGLRSAIAAAIRKHYYGDPTAFEPRPLPSAAKTTPLEVEAVGRTDRGTLITGGSTAAKLSTSVRGAGRSTASRVLQGVSEEDYTRSLSVLVGMLEASRDPQHSARIARLSRGVAELLGRSPQELTRTVLVAQLHALGRDPVRHLTLETLSADDSSRQEARRQVRTPVALLGGHGLPSSATTALLALLDAWDGSGATGLKGAEIPIAARIVSAVDSVLRLSRVEKNSRDELMGHLQTKSGVLYDPEVSRALVELLSGEPTRRLLAHDGRRVTVLDPSEAGRLALLAALHARGIAAFSPSRDDTGSEGVLRSGFDVLLLSAELGVSECLEALQFVRADPVLAGLPVIVYGALDVALDQTFREAGATETVSGSDPATLAFAAARQLEELRSSNGVGHPVKACSEQLPLAEALEVLIRTARSGRLRARTEAGDALVHLEDGRAVAASFREHQGVNAVAALKSAGQSDYVFDPDALYLDVPQD